MSIVILEDLMNAEYVAVYDERSDGVQPLPLPDRERLP